jgi:hypothetical protein
MADVLESNRESAVFKKKPNSKFSFFWLISIALAVVFLLTAGYAGKNILQKKFPNSFLASLSKSKKKTFVEKFNKKVNKKIEETGKMSQSSDKNWWVNSGGWMEISNGTGRTIMGDLSPDNKWYAAYQDSSPDDTDNGSHPQNIFRLVTRTKWQNFRQEAFFRINKINLSGSENRNESNGILLFNRYQDGDDLYYTGLRVDGYAVIKKKIGGDYHTLASERVFGGGDYNRDSNPNLLPLGRWIGLRSVLETKKNGDVEISLFYRMGRKASKKSWKLVARYTDKGQKGDKIENAGYGGIRTDFMDVEFDKYKITGL